MGGIRMLGGAEKLLNGIFSVFKIFSLLLIILILPRLFFPRAHMRNSHFAYSQQGDFRLGLENIQRKMIQDIFPSNNLTYNVGLITNQTGKSQQGIKNTHILKNAGLNIKKIFDSKNTISNDALKNVDLLIFDMQNCGVRHDIYINKLFQSIETASINKKPIIVLDRPNLLGPQMEGPLVEPDLKSETSLAPIPMRYGMTVGEIALFYNKNMLKKPANLHIIPMKNYRRNRHIKNQPLSQMSQNIKNINSCYCYSFLGLLQEIKPFHLGIGTDKSLECILLPDTILFSKKKWKELHKLLKSNGIANSFYRYFDGNKKIYFSGLQLKINDIFKICSFNLLLKITNFFKNSGVKMEFSKQFDTAAGTTKVREFLEGKTSYQKLKKIVDKDLRKFFRQASSCFLYTPFPKIEYLDIS